MDEHGESLAINLDTNKAFNQFWHWSLLSKLPALGLLPRVCNRVAGFMRYGRTSKFLPVNADVTSGSVLSPILFLLHFNYMFSHGNIHCYGTRCR